VSVSACITGQPDAPPHLTGTTPADDLRNAIRNAAGPRLVWMDDVGCRNWNCEAPTRAWKLAIAEGQVDEKSCRVEDESHGFCVGFLR